MFAPQYSKPVRDFIYKETLSQLMENVLQDMNWCISAHPYGGKAILSCMK
ncbi:MAG: hypothetical protein RLZZ142_1330 [Verrucomicrobiota bacterium]